MFVCIFEDFKNMRLIFEIVMFWEPIHMSGLTWTHLDLGSHWVSLDAMWFLSEISEGKREMSKRENGNMATRKGKGKIAGPIRLPRPH